MRNEEKQAAEKQLDVMTVTTTQFAFFVLCLCLPVEGSVALRIDSLHKSNCRVDYLKHFAALPHLNSLSKIKWD